ncbi:MAG: ABC transporter ATP-binding protein [Nitrospirae bacterium]|nr:ABC transporter ATP-binding protein [Nitrospirota bacterium]MCL5422705.1 ABC transporter ATP-binding protein [Nitrospirota bacterium]
MIEIQDCTKRFGELVAVNDLSLRVGESEIFGLLGPNGAGKSTTIKMMVGLMRPDSGTIKIGGYNITQDPVNAKRILAYVPEKGYTYEKLTAWEYLTFISGLYKIDEDLFEKNAAEYLEIFGLSQWKDEVIGSFSMGMKQRLLLSAAFMRNPKVVILDEPHNGLDPKGVRLLKDMLFRLRDGGTTIVLSTHIIAIAEQICDKIAIINKGSVVAQGTNEDLRQYAKSSDKNLEDIFLRLTSTYEGQEPTL